MNKKLLALSLCSLILVFLANSNFPASSTTNQSKEIQNLQKKIKILEANVKVLTAYMENLKSSNLKDAEVIDVLKGAKSQKLSFVAFLGRDLKCPIGSTPAEKLDGMEVEKGFPDGFSFKNIRLFGLLAGNQINLGVCEMSVISK